MALNCFRYLDFKSFAEIDQLEVPEYELLMEGVRLKQVDLDYRCHLIAWLTFAAKAEKKAGKGKSVPVFRRFRKFFDYEKALDKAKSAGQEKSRFSGFGKYLKSRG